MDASTIAELFDQVGSKKKDISKEAFDKVLTTSLTGDVSKVLDVAISKLDSSNKPAVIAVACHFIKKHVEAKTFDQTVYYMLIPAVSPLCLDVKKQIQDASKACIEVIYNSVVNKDLAQLIPDLIATMYKPELTEETIDKVASTKFVTTVTCGTIAILCPLLLRGYALRKDRISRLCSKIIVNMHFSAV